MGRYNLWVLSVYCGLFIAVAAYERGFSANGQPRAWAAFLCAAWGGGELLIPRPARHTSADWRHAGGTGLFGGDADVLYYSSIVLAGTGLAF